MTTRRVAALLVVTLALAGCGGAGRGNTGTARLWITRDRGSTLVVSTTVPAGQTLLRALRSKATIETRYGGRFVQSIDGISGSLANQRDWFWFVNGLAGDTSAAEYRLHAGDVAWWDYRDWGDDPELAVVVGAFPEPFVHGFGGRRRVAVVRYETPSQRAAARRIAHRIHASGIARLGLVPPAGANVFELRSGGATFVARQRTPGTGPHGPVVLVFSGDVEKLLAGAYARRFSVP